MKTGVILLGHGSRREEANDEIRQIGQMVMEGDQDGCYEVAFLSFASPSLTDAAEDLIARGLDSIVVVPIFLVTGNHIKRDIPSKLLLLKTSHPEVKFILAKHFGVHPEIVKIVQERIMTACGLVEGVSG
jgi:sirohydrochlorin ferrochelatase